MENIRLPYWELLDESGFEEEVSCLRRELDSCIQTNRQLEDEIRAYQEKELEKILKEKTAKF